MLLQPNDCLFTCTEHFLTCVFAMTHFVVKLRGKKQNCSSEALQCCVTPDAHKTCFLLLGPLTSASQISEARFNTLLLFHTGFPILIEIRRNWFI